MHRDTEAVSFRSKSGLAFLAMILVLGVGASNAGPPAETTSDAGARAGSMKRHLLRLPSGGIVDLRDGTVCEYHGITLKADTVRVIYGLNYNTEGFVDGGCVVTPESPAWAIVSYCERCRNPLFQGPLLGVREARGDERRCDLHDMPMEEDVVPIAYGLPGWDREEYDARKVLFPNACLYFLGGCIVNIDSPQTARVRFCGICRDERKVWYAKQ